MDSNNNIHRRITKFVHDSMFNAFGTRVSFRENFILNIAGYIYPRVFKHYEYIDHRKTLARGYGLCSQQCIVVSGLLKEHGIDSKIIDIGGHVVVECDGKILDPDYGYVFEGGLTEDIIEYYYPYEHAEVMLKTDNRVYKIKLKRFIERTSYMIVSAIKLYLWFCAVCMFPLIYMFYREIYLIGREDISGHVDEKTELDV